MRVMKDCFIIFLIFAISFSHCIESDVDSDFEDFTGLEKETRNTKSLIEIEDEVQFYDFIEANKNSLVLFSRKDENCVDCQIAVKQIEKAMKLYEGECEFLFVDCVSHYTYPVCQKYEIQKLPTISLLSEMLAVYEFSEFLIAENIINFINKYSAEKLIKVSTDQEIESLIEENRVVIIGFFSSQSEELKSFRRLAANMIYQYPFAEVQIGEENKKVMEKYEIKESAVVIFKRVANERSHRSILPPYNRKILTYFVSAQAPAPIYKGTNENFQLIAEANLPVLVIVFNSPENSENNKNVYNDFEMAAESYRNAFTFSYSVFSGDKEEDYQELKRWGYTLESYPIMLIYDIKTREAYTFDETKPINLFAINKFCDDYLLGKISPHLIKQSLPTSNENEKVKIVVYDNFRKIVHDHSKDVAVLFYLPEDMCRHCVDFLNNYEIAAATLSSSPLFENVVLAKMDMFANQIAPGLNIRAFPTLLYFPKNDKYNEISFASKRTAENIVTWLTEQAEASASSSTINFEDLTQLPDENYII